MPAEYDKYFGYAGIKIKNENAGKSIPYTGLASRMIEGRVFISAVSRNSAAWVDGLNVNDEVISVDGVPVDSSVERMSVISDKKVGDVVKFQVVRDGIEKMIPITLKANPNLKLVPEPNSKATAQQLKVRKKWMGI